MNKSNPAILYLAIFIFGAIILNISGIINLSSVELLAYIFMFSGMTLFFRSFGNDRKGLLFIGSTLFLIGVMVYINTKFELEDTRLLLFPSVLFIIGIGFMLLFIDESNDKVYLIISSAAILGGVLFMVFFKISALEGFFTSLWNLFKGYWIVIVLVLGLIFFLRKDRI